MTYKLLRNIRTKLRLRDKFKLRFMNPPFLRYKAWVCFNAARDEILGYHGWMSLDKPYLFYYFVNYDTIFPDDFNKYAFHELRELQIEREMNRRAEFYLVPATVYVYMLKRAIIYDSNLKINPILYFDDVDFDYSTLKEIGDVFKDLPSI